MQDLKWLRGSALMLLDMLAQSANRPFLLAHREFQFLVQVLIFFGIVRAEQFEKKHCHLCEIAKNVFEFTAKPSVFGTTVHISSLP